MFNFVHRVTIAIAILLFSNVHAQESGWRCSTGHPNIGNAEAFNVDQFAASAQACSNVYGPATVVDNRCFIEDHPFLPPNQSLFIGCAAVNLCYVNGQYEPVGPDGTCPNTCPSPLGGLEPYDTPDCGCSDSDYVPFDSGGVGPLEHKRGCLYEPLCPNEGVTAANECSGPNGIQGNYQTCLPFNDPQGEYNWCPTTYSEDGRFTYNGGRATVGCSATPVPDVTDYGCDGSGDKGDTNIEGGDSGDTEEEETVINDNGTPDDPSDDVTKTTKTTTETKPDGTVVTTTTTTINNNKTGDVTITTTVNTRDPDGTSTTETEITNQDGDTTESTTGTGGQGTCTGPDCDDIEKDGTGTTAGKCGKPPVCTGKPIDCAALAQEYNLQCGVQVSDHLDCDQPVSCEGNPTQCAIIEQQKQRQCWLANEEGLSDEDSLEEDLPGDDGSEYNPEDGSNEISLVDGFKTDSTGLGWAASCPADRSVSFSIRGKSYGFSLSFVEFCNWLAFLNPIVIFLGFIHAGFIFLRGMTNG
ncbi:MAG: hypothetical protein KTR16_02440 [Acidiferrobacterales bacterium]|nr:hypothetical protein [Acidiferrobacterales bacterium]